MCFGHARLPKPQLTPTVSIPQVQPIQQQQAVTQTGADEAAIKSGSAATPLRKSLFQFDLTIPTGPQGSSQTGAAS